MWGNHHTTEDTGRATDKGQTESREPARTASRQELEICGETTTQKRQSQPTDNPEPRSGRGSERHPTERARETAQRVATGAEINPAKDIGQTLERGRNYGATKPRNRSESETQEERHRDQGEDPAETDNGGSVRPHRGAEPKPSDTATERRGTEPRATAETDAPTEDKSRPKEAPPRRTGREPPNLDRGRQSRAERLETIRPAAASMGDGSQMLRPTARRRPWCCVRGKKPPRPHRSEIKGLERICLLGCDFIFPLVQLCVVGLSRKPLFHFGKMTFVNPFKIRNY